MNDKTAKVETGNGNSAGARRGSPAEDETPKVEGKQLAVIMISVLLGILLAALDQTIVGPALPQIIGDLNGFENYSWVVTIYLLTSTITVPIFGKLSDMYGRKWLYLSGIGVFLLGSALSGLSQDMLQLIIFRGIQGLGAGILFALAFAIIADLIPPANRGKWQGAFGAVFGLSSVVGPFIGGALTDGPGWRWVFYVNIPVGAVAIAVLLATFPHETKSASKKAIDWLGAFTLTAGLTPLLLALSLGGTSNPLNIPGIGAVTDWAWSSPNIIGLFAVAVAFLAAFIYIESRAKEPILPLDLFKSRIFTTSVITVFVTGVGLFGAILYIPLFVQAIQGDNATESGNAVIPMTLAIVFSSIVTGQIISRTGKYRIIGIIGMSLTTLGMGLLWTMNMDTDRLTTIFYMIVMGLGLGIAFPLYTLVVQNAFPIQRVGVVTAAITFFRSIGSAVGVAVLGSVVNNQFHDKFGPEFVNRYNTLKSTVPPQAATNMPNPESLLTNLSNLNPNVLVGAENLARLEAQLVANGTPAAFVDGLIGVITGAMRPALFAGIQSAFLIGAIVLGVGLLSTMFLTELPLRKSNKGPAIGMGEGEFVAEERGKEMATSGMPTTTLPARDEATLATGSK